MCYPISYISNGEVNYMLIGDIFVSAYMYEASCEISKAPNINMAEVEPEPEPAPFPVCRPPLQRGCARASAMTRVLSNSIWWLAETHNILVIRLADGRPYMKCLQVWVHLK